MPHFTSNYFPQEIRDIILDYVVADDEKAIGTAMHESIDGIFFIAHRYPILRTCSILRRDGLRAFLRVNQNLLEQPISLSRCISEPLKIPDILRSLRKPYIYNSKVKLHIDDVCKFGVCIWDEFFKPYEYQSMSFGDLVWDHVVPDVVETYNNAAGLLSDLEEMMETLPVSRQKFRFQIVYTLSSNYAAEAFGDARVEEFWHDHPMTVDILINDPKGSSCRFEMASTILRQIFDDETKNSVEEMIERGYIPAARGSGTGIFYEVKEDWYNEDVLPGREKIFETWLGDIRSYHDMLLRVIEHMWHSPASEREARRGALALKGLEGLDLDVEDLQGHIRGVGHLIDGLESGAYVVAGVSPYTNPRGA